MQSYVRTQLLIELPNARNGTPKYHRSAVGRLTKSLAVLNPRLFKKSTETSRILTENMFFSRIFVDEITENVENQLMLLESQPIFPESVIYLGF